MHQKGPKKSCLKKATERVKRLFTEINQHLCYNIEELAGHRYDQVKVPRVPLELRRLALYGNHFKTPFKKRRHWTSKSEEGSRQLLSLGMKGVALNPGRFKLCKLKEHYLASRKLKSISGQRQMCDQQIHCKVDLLKGGEENPGEQEERLRQWEEILHSHEERHFQIDRIIKYLSD